MDALDALLNAKGKKRKRDLMMKEAMAVARKEIKLRRVENQDIQQQIYRDDRDNGKGKYRRVHLPADTPKHFRPVVNGRIYTCSKEYLFESWISLKIHGIRWIFWMEDFPHPDWEDVKEKEWWPHTDIEFVKVELEGNGAYPTKDFPYTVCKTLDAAIEEQTKEALSKRKDVSSEDETIMCADVVDIHQNIGNDVRSDVATGNAILLVDATASRVVTTTAICIALANGKVFPEVCALRGRKGCGKTDDIPEWGSNEQKVRVALDWYHEIIGIPFTYKADKDYIERALG
jgi:hypothetical protein